MNMVKAKSIKNTNSQIRVVSNNSYAFYQYEIQDSYEAGLVLLGTEVKSLRKHSPSLRDSYCSFIGDSLFLYNLSIPEYSAGWRSSSYDQKRLRKLLLHKRELSKLIGSVKKKHFTIIPTQIYFNDRGYAKIKIGVARGKNEYDKKQTIKERDIAIEVQREIDDMKIG